MADVELVYLVDVEVFEFVFDGVWLQIDLVAVVSVELVFEFEKGLVELVVFGCVLRVVGCAWKMG